MQGRVVVGVSVLREPAVRYPGHDRITAVGPRRFQQLDEGPRFLQSVGPRVVEPDAIDGHHGLAAVPLISRVRAEFEHVNEVSPVGR